MPVPSDSPLVDAARVVQLRAVLWSMRKVIDGVQHDGAVARSLLFELRALAEAGVALADGVIDQTE